MYVYNLVLHLGSLNFRKCMPRPTLSDTDILRHSVLDLKLSTRSVTANIFDRSKRKKFFAWEYAKEVVGGLGTD